MPITRSLALKIIKYLLDNPSFYFPFLVMRKGYTSNTEEHEDFVEIVPNEDYQDLLDSPEYNTFELWTNLQYFDEQTIMLLSKGFIEEILNENAISKIEESAKGYRELWQLDVCESAKILEYGFNEFLGGKAEGFEESLEILKLAYLKS